MTCSLNARVHGKKIETMRRLWYKTINKVKEVYRIMTDPNEFLAEIDGKITATNEEKTSLDSEVEKLNAEHQTKLEGINTRRTELSSLVSNLETTRERIAWYASHFAPPAPPKTEEQPEQTGDGDGFEATG